MIINEEQSLTLVKLLATTNTNLEKTFILNENLTFKQSLMLLVIAPLSKITVAAVAKACHTSKQNSEKMLTILIKNGYLNKEKIANKYQLQLTRKAFIIYRQLNKTLQQILQSKLQKFQESDIVLFIELLKAINM